MADEPVLTHRLLRTKEAAAYLSVSEWKLRLLIQDEIIPVVQDQRGGPFLLDLRDLTSRTTNIDLAIPMAGGRRRCFWRPPLRCCTASGE